MCVNILVPLTINCSTSKLEPTVMRKYYESSEANVQAHQGGEFILERTSVPCGAANDERKTDFSDQENDVYIKCPLRLQTCDIFCIILFNLVIKNKIEKNAISDWLFFQWLFQQTLCIWSNLIDNQLQKMYEYCKHRLKHLTKELRQSLNKERKTSVRPRPCKKAEWTPVGEKRHESNHKCHLLDAVMAD